MAKPKRTYAYRLRLDTSNGIDEYYVEKWLLGPTRKPLEKEGRYDFKQFFTEEEGERWECSCDARRKWNNACKHETMPRDVLTGLADGSFTREEVEKEGV